MAKTKKDKGNKILHFSSYCLVQVLDKMIYSWSSPPFAMVVNVAEIFSNISSFD